MNNDTADLVWYLFEKTGETRYYMLYNRLCEINLEKDYDEGMSL